MKLHLFRCDRFVITIFIIYTLILNPLPIFADDSTIPQNSLVEATVSDSVINVVIKEEKIADIITVSVMPFIAESFVGYNDIIPGLKKEGILEIKNETGETYKVIDYNFFAEIANLKRIYNDAAEIHFGSASEINNEKASALSGDEWYQINAYWFGEENFENMDILRKMFGWGDTTQGAALSGYETGQKMIDLGFKYLFQNCIQFSFNINTDPVNNYDTKNIHILDYINKTEANKALVLNKFFADDIGDENLLMDIGYSMDNSSIGNAYISAYADFGFEIILERIVSEEMETIEPEKPDITNPNIVGQLNPSSDLSLIRDDEVSIALEANPDIAESLYKNPKTGMPDDMVGISFLFVISGIAILIYTKQQ